MSPRVRAALAVVVVAFAVVGCADDDPTETSPTVQNEPPETSVDSTPPDLEATSFTIDFAWSGTDEDGEVAWFEWVITDNGPDNVFAPEDTTGADKWNRIDATDSTFVVSADLPDFPADDEDPRFWQTHTFLIRAVDDDGAADPTPATVSFTATTIAPDVVITRPSFPIVTSCSTTGSRLAFGPEVRDDDALPGQPAEIRTVLVEWGGPDDPCLTDVLYEELDPIASLDESAWGPWTPYEGEDHVVRYPELGAPVGTSYLFGVQARDAAGAVTPMFVFGKNVVHVRTSAARAPVLRLDEPDLGTFEAVGTGNVYAFDVVAGQPFEFTWVAEAATYASLIEGYRYGFGIVDPENQDDPNWAGDWGYETSAVLPAGFEAGATNVVVQARDYSGGVTRVLLDLQVIPLKRRADQRPLLFVDDSDERNSPSIEAFFDQEWERHLSGVTGFSPVDDVFDVTASGATLDFRRLNDYRAVLWIVSSDTRTFVANRLAPRPAGRSPHNWLETYQKYVGNVMLAGPRVMSGFIENINLIQPVVFDLDQSPPAGLGSTETIDGESVNVGTRRYPYTAWCLESVDFVRAPNIGQLGESGRRSTGCDVSAYARVTSAYVERYGPSPVQVGNLRPTSAREAAGDPSAPREDQDLFSEFGATFDEFYDRNVAERPILLTLRDCQVPMYEAIARMDVDNVEVMQPVDRDEAYHLPVRERLVPTRVDPVTGNVVEDCPAVREGRETSTVTGAPIVIASTQYVDTKQNGLAPFEDYVWGFNPISYQPAEVAAAIEWILLNQWGLNQ